MIYSKSTQYAIRAITFLAARPSSTYCHLEMIAVAEQIPQHFLAKLMQRLARKRIVHSIKGVRGGFALALPAETVTLYMLADAIDDLVPSVNECIFRDNECSDIHNCPLHEPWKKLREQQLHFLQTISIADLVKTRTQ